MVEKFEIEITPFKLLRTIHLYLPNDYYTSNEAYPVLYMYDGHNLFDDRDATYGKSWGLKDYLDTHQKLIVVGIECNHEGNQRLEEFSPYVIENSYFGQINGRGDVLMDWVVHELKDYIDQNYRTLSNRQNTFIGGSSMGGLMSIYSIVVYHEIFSKAICISSSVGMCFDQVIQEIKAIQDLHETQVFLSGGSEEVRNKKGLAYQTAMQLEVAHLMSEKGADVYPYLQVDGKHNEASWEKLIPIFMEYFKI